MNNLKELKRIFKSNSSGDAWGDSMAFAFPLCEVLYLRDAHDIPELMKYRPSPMGVRLDDECFITQEIKDIDTETLEDFGRLLNRVIDILKKQKRDY